MLFLYDNHKHKAMKKGFIPYVILFAVTFIICLPSCTKPSTTKKAKVLFVNTAANTSMLDFYIDATKENTTPIVFQATTAYSAITPGSHTVKAIINANSSTVVDTSINFAPGGIYSVFVIDTPPNISALVLNDTLATPPAGMANIRIVNMVSNSPAFNLGVVGSSALATNLKFESNSGFITVNPGTLALQLTLTSNGTVVSNFPNLTLSANKGYTVCITGIYGEGVSPVLMINL